MVQTATLPLMLKQLNLSSIACHWQAMLTQAERNGWNAAQYLSALCEQELADRHSRRIARYSKESHLPVGKSLASFDFAEIPSLERGPIEALAGSTDWTRRARNVLLFGPSGVGKTHLAAAIGHGLTEHGVRVRYFATTALVQQLQLAREQLRLEDALHKLDKYPAVILDDFGYVKKNDQETQVLFELIAHRYETGSLIITSNQPFADWDRIFPDRMMTVAAVDRLVHHATIIEVTSDSYRRKEALDRVAAAAPTMAPPATTTPSATTITPPPATTTPSATTTTPPVATALPSAPGADVHREPGPPG